MKKISALLLIFVMLLSMFTSFAVTTASAVNVSATAEDKIVSVGWNYGYIASASHSTKPNQTVAGTSSGTYKYSDVITIAEKGTTISFYDPTGHTSSNAYVISSWVSVNGSWALDINGVNIYGVSASNKASNSTIQMVDSNGGCTYFYTTWKDNESIRITYCTTGNTTDPDVHVIKNGAAPTINDGSTVSFNADGTVTGIRWISGYVGSNSNAQNCQNKLRIDSGSYTFSDFILIPEKGTKITFTDTASPFAAASAWTISSWMISESTGNYVIDLEGANFSGADTAIIAATDTSSRTYSYVTYKDNELIRLCYQSAAGGGVVPANTPAVKWEKTTEKATFAPGSSVIVDTFYYESPEAPYSAITHTPLKATEITGVKWNYGYVGSRVHNTYPNQIKTGGNTYMYSDIITIPKAGTTVFFFDDDFVDPNGNKYASVNAAIFSTWKQSGSTWVVDTTKENPDGASANQITVGHFKQYSYTTVEDNEHIRLCYNAPTSDAIMPPKPYKVFAVAPHTFTPAGAAGTTATSSYVNANGSTVNYSVYLPANYDENYFGTFIFSVGKTSEIAKALAAAGENAVIVYSEATGADAALLLEDVLVAYSFNRTFSYLVSSSDLRDCKIFYNVAADFTAGGSFQNALEAGKSLLSKKPEYHPILEKITMYAIGDSYFAGESLGKDGTWVNKMGNKYGMTFENYGIGGSTVSDFVTNRNPMVKRFKSMESGDASVILLEGGRNDRTVEVPLGTNDSHDSKTFLGALNIMIDDFLVKYPNAVIILVTPWKQSSPVAATGFSNVTYANAMRDLVKFRNDPRIYCIYAADPSATGINMDDANCRAKYCISPTDVSHLNEAGMAMIQPFMEGKIVEALESYAAYLRAQEETTAEATTETEAPETTVEGTVTEPVAEDKGCGSVAAPAVILLSFAAAFVFVRKKH